MTVLSKLFILCAITTSFTVSAVPVPDGTVPNIAAAPSPSKIIILGDPQYEPSSHSSFPGYASFSDDKGGFHPGTPRDITPSKEALSDGGSFSTLEDKDSLPTHPGFSKDRDDSSGVIPRTFGPFGNTINYGDFSSPLKGDHSFSHHPSFSGVKEHSHGHHGDSGGLPFAPTTSGQEI